MLQNVFFGNQSVMLMRENMHWKVKRFEQSFISNCIGRDLLSNQFVTSFYLAVLLVCIFFLLRSPCTRHGVWEWLYLAFLIVSFEKREKSQLSEALVTCCTHLLAYRHLCTGSRPGVPVVLSPLGCASWRWDWTDERLWCEHHVQSLL